MKKFQFPGIHYWLFLLIPLTIWAFYPTYFSIMNAVPSVFHVHALFMLLWIALVILQPLLIYPKKTKLHKLSGRISYVLFPMIVITTWLMLRHSYLRYYNIELEAYTGSVSPEAAVKVSITAGHQLRLGILYLFSLIVFYSSGIIFRKTTAYHATFMFAASLTLIGPTVDRIVYPMAQKYFPQFSEINVAFILIDLLLAALLLYQVRNGTRTGATVFSLIFYISWQWWFYTMPELEIWSRLVKPFG